MSLRHRCSAIAAAVALSLVPWSSGYGEAPPNVTADDAWHAVQGGSIDALKAFLAMPGVDVNDRYVVGKGSDDTLLLTDDKSLLDLAAEANKMNLVGYLIDHGAWVNGAQQQGLNQGITPAHRAAFFNAAAALELLIAHGANINAKHGTVANGLGGTTPLMYAAVHDSLQAAEVLLRHGADLSASSVTGETADTEARSNHHPDFIDLLDAYRARPAAITLSDAARNGDLEQLQKLLLNKPDGQALDQALIATLVAGSDRPEARLGIVAALLDHGARTRQADGASVLQWANTADIARRLLAANAEPLPSAERAQMEEHIACNPAVTDPVSVLRVLIARNGHLSSDARTGRAMLRCAVLAHQTDLASLLMEQGVDPTSRDALGRTLLFEASDAPMVELLVRHGVPVDVVDSLQDTALGTAIATLHTQAAVTLIGVGANSHLGGPGLLYEAVQTHQRSVLSALISNGADVNVRDEQGRTALFLAAEANDELSTRALVEGGAEVNARDKEGSTPLHLAAAAGANRTAAYLLEQHANPNLRDYQGRLPLDRAKTDEIRPLLAVQPSTWDATLSTADASACAEIARRAGDGSLGHVAVFGEPPAANRDPNDNWAFLAQVPTRFQVSVAGNTFVIGTGPTGPVYLSHVDSQNIEKVVCEFAAVANSVPQTYRVLGPGERLPGDLASGGTGTPMNLRMPLRAGRTTLSFGHTGSSPSATGQVPTNLNNPSTVTIVGALYGSTRNGRGFDLTKALSSQCSSSHACEVHCGNEIAADPDFGYPKICRIEFQCGLGPTQQIQTREGERVTLRCP